jgi:4-amino-4-deoxy-L-arabinose transferase-like glycosyltransferase
MRGTCGTLFARARPAVSHISRRTAYALIALACVTPRLVVLLLEREKILAAFTEKSDTFAQTFVDHGTFGFIPGQPSAYTQPLYGWFLIGVYGTVGRHWETVGIAQIVVAIVVAWLVYEIGRPVLGSWAGLVAGVVATLNPYLIWHDVHINREIVDQLCATALVLLTLRLVDRPTVGRAASAGVVAGLAMLGNTRLVFVPILCAAYVLWRLGRTRAAATAAVLLLAGSAVAVAPWLVRNKANVGCWALTTDGRAMWKANNLRTRQLLEEGQWIDNVGPNPPRPPAPGRLTPEEAWGVWIQTHGRVKPHPDECLEMTFYEDLAFDYWRDHPGDKTRLMLLSAKLLWQPNAFETSERPGAGTHLDVGRRVIEPLYMWIVYVLAAVGLFFVPRPFLVLALALLAYNTAAALAFVGATRYRVAWDFLVVLFASAALVEAAKRLQARRTRQA